ncbi:MAG TPA: BatA domain-containing protein [Candidatus Krumholzibacteria bacterium]|nr:BatA domain-containing protein [Candidatus Krumholzibacteria bacterium]
MGFLNAAFLIGLVAAAVPVIIHLLNRRRVKRMRFSSLEFLEEVNRQRMRRINLRRILILLLRTLAILALVLAFARPTLRSGLLFSGTVPKNVIVCLDASYSMGLEEETGTVFDAARTVAKDVIDAAGSSDAVNLVVFARRAEPALERGTRNKSVVKAAVDRAALTSETTSIRAAVDRALRLIDESDVDGGEIYVISDFRASEDSVVVDDAQLPDDVRLYFIPTGKGDADNVSVDRVAVPRKLLRPGEAVRVSVTATNHSRHASASVPLEILLDGDRKAEQVVELAPQASQTVSFPLSVGAAGRYHGRVGKNHDRLPVDDDRYFLVEVSNSIPVAVLGSRRRLPAADDATPAVFYVEKALNPRATPEGEFTVRSFDERDVTANALPAGGVVVWVDPQEMEPRRMALLERHVRRGGGLLVFLGNVSSALRDDAAFKSLIGARGFTDKTADGRAAFTSFEKAHPVFSLFTGDELELLSRAKVRSYTAARGVAPDSVLAYIGGGDPAMWEAARGAGRVLVIVPPVGLASGDVPLSPMFLPLVHTSVSYLAGSGDATGGEEHLVGAPISFEISPTGLDESQLVIRDPAGGALKPAVGDRSGGDVVVSCEQPLQPGFFRLFRDTTRVAELAVNVDTRESNLSVSSLPRKPPQGVSVVEAGTSFRDDLREAREGREIYALFILTAIAALVAESILGRKA